MAKKVKKTKAEKKKEINRRIDRLEERVKSDRVKIKRYKERLEKLDYPNKKTLTLTESYPYDDDLKWDFIDSVEIEIGKKSFEINIYEDDGEYEMTESVIRKRLIEFVNANKKQIGKIKYRKYAYDAGGFGAKSNTFKTGNISGVSELIKYIKKIDINADNFMGGF